MDIEFRGLDTEQEDDLDFLQAIVVRCLRSDYPQAIVYTRSRTPSGCIEWGIDFRREDGTCAIYVGAIQRTLGTEVEFHS